MGRRFRVSFSVRHIYHNTAIKTNIYNLSTFWKNGGCCGVPKMFHAHKEEPFVEPHLDCFRRKYQHQLMWIQMVIVLWWLLVNNNSPVVLIDMGAVVDTNNWEFFCSSGGGPHTRSLLGTVTSSCRSYDSSFEKRISLILSPSCYWQQTGWNMKFNKGGILGRWK